MRCLIVSKTRAVQSVCIGAISTDGTCLRLTERPNYPFLPQNTHYEIGQVWDIECTPSENITPPHVEDVLVHRYRYLYSRSDMETVLKQLISPWKGHVIEVFDRKTRYTNNGSRYIQDDIPDCSVGFWISNKALEFRDSYYWYDRFRMKYVGLSTPPKVISAGKLVRVSLSRWFKPQDIEDNFPARCYLQISGVY